MHVGVPLLRERVALVVSARAAAGGGADPAWAPPPVCTSCELPATPGCTLSKCSRCKAVIYCSRACQLADWTDHKQGCKAAFIAARLPAASAAR